MTAPVKLFLEFNNIDGKFHVNNAKGLAFGTGHEIPDAIQSARVVADVPIDIGESHAGFERHCVVKKPVNAEADSEVFIQMLAELAGMKVTKLFNDNLHFLGYTMELKEDDDDFIKAAIAEEQHENELVTAMGSYIEEE